MAFRVDLTLKARRDISIAEAWVASLGQSYVSRWRGRFLRAVRELERDATRFPEADENADVPFELREATFGTWPHVYRILFTLKDAVVTVLRVRHAARDRISDSDL